MQIGDVLRPGTSPRRAWTARWWSAGVGLGLTLLTSGAHATGPHRAEGVACAEAAEAAQLAMSEKKLLEAHASLLQCATDSCPTMIRQDCVRWLDEVTTSTPTIVLRVREAGVDVLSPRCLIDGRPASVGGTAVPVNPGAHSITVIQKNRSHTSEILVAEGEKRRLILIDLPGPPERPTATPTPAPTTAQPTSPWPWVLFGVSAVGFGSFGGLQLAASAKYDDLAASCSPRCDPQEADKVRSLVTLSAIGLAVGVVALGVGAWWFVSNHRASSRSASTSSLPLILF